MIRAGQRLREERTKKGLSLEEVSKSTKIRLEFLSAIEKGEYQKLPSAAYAAGFVRNYARFLGLPEKEILPLFRREFDQDKVLKVLPQGLVGSLDFPLRGFKIGQALIVGIFIFVVLVAYILYQYRYAFISPPLRLIEPLEMAVILSDTFEVSGKTDASSTVFVENSPVSVDKNGNFKKEITVFPGKATITIRAVNKFGKETIVQRHIEVNPTNQ